MTHRFTTGSVSVFALALLCLAPRAGVAQNNYTQQMQGYMAQYAQSAQSRGYSPVTPMVTGNLNQGANTSHNFPLTAGRNYVIIGVCDRDCTDVDLRLYDASGNTIASDVAVDDHPTLQFTAGMSGNFRLQVEMATCSTNPCYYGVQLFGGAMGGGNSGVALAPQPQPMGQPQPMAISAPTAMGVIAANQQVTGNLTAMDGRWDGKPAQTWQFQCQPGQAFQMDVLSTWDNYAIVFDPMGTPVAHDDDGGPEGLNARISYTCAMAGMYRLAVTTYTSSTTPGTYTLQVQAMAPVALNQPMPMNQPQALPTAQPMQLPVQQSAPGATMPSPAPISLPLTGSIPAPGQIGQIQIGTNVQGRLETGDQRMNDGTFADVWQFSGTAGQHIIIELRSEEFDTYVQLLDAAGNRLAEDDDSLGDLDSKVEITLPSSGGFQIVVNNFGEDRRAGIYTLTLR